MKILFLPNNKEITTDETYTILETALMNDIYISASCNSQGRCGKCKIILKGGKVFSASKASLTKEEIDNNYYLACQTFPRSDLIVEIPKESRLTKAKVTDESFLKTKSKNIGIAIDIGTTTVSINSIDIDTKKTINTISSYNYQIIHGEDVLTRISFCKNKGCLEKLNKLIINNINDLTKRLAINNIKNISITGNTTMNYLLLKKDPQIIKKNIQIDEFRQSTSIKANKIGLTTSSQAYIFPGISNYVGGDIVADILSSGLFKEEQTSLLIDVGTNGEVALGNKEWIITASTSAGPAFEGGEVRFGQRAMEGVIESITIDDKPTYKVIGNKKPKGICGSALIDLIAELLTNNIIDRHGNFINNSKITKKDNNKAFIIAKKEETGINQDIYITESEIKNIIMSKAAIYAGFYTLLKTLNIELKDINKFFISGNFGNFINIENAIKIGMLPNIKRDKFIFLGNGALKGASMIINNKNNKDIAKNIAKKTEYLDLHKSNIFMDEYQKAMFLPHTELERFT